VVLSVSFKSWLDNYRLPKPYYHQSLIPHDLRNEGWNPYEVGSRQDSNLNFYISNTFQFSSFQQVEKFVTMIDKLEVDYRVHNIVIVDREENSVEVRLTSNKFKVPSMIEVKFARMITVRYYNLLQKDKPKSVLFIDFDGTVRCVVKTEDSKKPFRAPTECEEVEVFPQAVERLKKAREEGYFIIGITNQSGITSRGIPVSKIAACVEETKRQLGMDFPVYFADKKDHNYKPAIGMGLKAIQDYGAIDFENSLMVGDNHRNGDRGFAEGMGVPFKFAHDYFDLTPEQMIKCGQVEEEFNVELLGDASTSELSKIDAYDLATSDVVTGDFTTDSLKFSVLRKAEEYLEDIDFKRGQEIKLGGSVGLSGEDGSNYKLRPIRIRNFNNTIGMEYKSAELGFLPFMKTSDIWFAVSDWESNNVRMNSVRGKFVQFDGGDYITMGATLSYNGYKNQYHVESIDGYVATQSGDTFGSDYSFYRNERGIYPVISLENTRYNFVGGYRAESFNAEAPLKEESIEAPYEVKVYVPSTAIDEPVTEREFRKRIVETQEFLSTLFGGFTTLQAQGGYMSDMEGLITEPVVVVATWASQQDYADRLEDLEEFLRVKRTEWQQEVIGFEFENDFFMFPAYQESAAEFFLAESKLTSKEKAEEGFFKSAEKNLQKYISQMLGMAQPTTFTNDEGELVVVNRGYGTEEDHRVLEDYEKWLFKNCESLMVERGEYFSCTMRYEAQMKECYYNSLMYSWEDVDAQYYEGWVVSESLSLPIRHAWIVKDGQVFDPTFDVLRRDRGSKTDERIYYYGTHIPSGFMRLFMFYSSYAGPYLFDYFFYDTYGEDAYDEFAGKEPQGSLEFSRSALRQMANPFMAEGDTYDS
jgi:HAD superfamily hydrolase (TIGR01662 family)